MEISMFSSSLVCNLRQIPLSHIRGSEPNAFPANRSVFRQNSARIRMKSSSIRAIQGCKSNLESLFSYDKSIPEEIIEKPIGLSLNKREIGSNPPCLDCQEKGVILCATCSGSGLYVDSILESQGIIVKVRCLDSPGILSAPVPLPSSIPLASPEPIPDNTALRPQSEHTEQTALKPLHVFTGQRKVPAPPSALVDDSSPITGCGGSGNIMCAGCGGRGHVGID